MRTKRTAVTFTAWWLAVTLATRYNHFPISPSSLSGTWSIVRVWPAARGPDVSSTIITTASHEGITCLIAHWIYMRQVITRTKGYWWLMACVSPLHAVFVFIWQSSPLSPAAAEISVPFGWCGVRACVCLCIIHLNAYLWAIIFRASLYPSHSIFQWTGADAELRPAYYQPAFPLFSVETLAPPNEQPHPPRLLLGWRWLEDWI